MTPEKRTVWILGAGFSKSLGGPLLTDLLSPKAQRETQHNFTHDTSVRQVYEVFLQHQKPGFRQHTHIQQRDSYWEHAEEFLDYIDTAAHNPDGTRGKILTVILGSLARDNRSLGYTNDLDQFHRCAQRVVASECYFAETFDGKAERDEPYINWAKGLSGQDRIITFNYDRVLERIAEAELNRIGRSSILLPTDNFERPGVHVYKLHGSVDWFLDGSEVKQIHEPKSLLAGDKTPLIATPGPTKKAHSEGPLAKLWKAAKEALKTADRIVFLGYRFPPSDAQSRSELLGAIRENMTPTVLRIDTVLGLPSDDSKRLGHLLTAAASKFRGNDHVPRPHLTGGARFYRLTPHPLFVEDFLSLYPHVVG